MTLIDDDDGKRKGQVFQVRLSTAERSAWESEAVKREMTLSQMIRSAVATMIACGKNTVVVPAAPEPAYVEELRAADPAGEPVRGTAGLNRKSGVEAAALKERQRGELKKAAARGRKDPDIYADWPATEETKGSPGTALQQPDQRCFTITKPVRGVATARLTLPPQSEKLSAVEGDVGAEAVPVERPYAQGIVLPDYAQMLCPQCKAPMSERHPDQGGGWRCTVCFPPRVEIVAMGPSLVATGPAIDENLAALQAGVDPSPHGISSAPPPYCASCGIYEVISAGDVCVNCRRDPPEE